MFSFTPRSGVRHTVYGVLDVRRKLSLKEGRGLLALYFDGGFRRISAAAGLCASFFRLKDHALSAATVPRGLLSSGAEVVQRTQNVFL